LDDRELAEVIAAHEAQLNMRAARAKSPAMTTNRSAVVAPVNTMDEKDVASKMKAKEAADRRTRAERRAAEVHGTDVNAGAGTYAMYSGPPSLTRADGFSLMVRQCDAVPLTGTGLEQTETGVDFMLRVIHLERCGRPEYSAINHQLYFYSSGFFGRWKGGRKDLQEKDQKHLLSVSIFTKVTLVIPVAYNRHWSVILVGNPGSFAGGEDNRPLTFVHLDSCSGKNIHSTIVIVNTILDHLRVMWESAQTKPLHRRENPRLQLVKPRSPQQPEGSLDCGRFVALNVDHFCRSVRLIDKGWAGGGLLGLWQSLPADMGRLRTEFASTLEKAVEEKDEGAGAERCAAARGMLVHCGDASFNAADGEAATVARMWGGGKTWTRAPMQETEVRRRTAPNVPTDAKWESLFPEEGLLMSLHLVSVRVEVPPAWGAGEVMQSMHVTPTDGEQSRFVRWVNLQAPDHAVLMDLPVVCHDQVCAIVFTFYPKAAGETIDSLHFELAVLKADGSDDEAVTFTNKNGSTFEAHILDLVGERNNVRLKKYGTCV
jgi:hypothetical protein